MRGERLAVDKPNHVIGAGGHGHTFPGASLPFGMAQLSPDTNTHGWDACSGYPQKDGSIMGFSHTHLSGTGIGDMLDILVLPTRRELKLEPGTLEKPGEGFRQCSPDDHAETGPYRDNPEHGVHP